MLTPEFLNLIEFNNVVKIYEKLNIDITVDIIKRVSAMDDITSTTKEQLKIIKQTNGTEIFNKTIEKTSLLTADTKKALKKLYEDTAKEDMKGYKELYEYRNKLFKLSENQYKILNQGLRETNRTLKNFTNTIAFQSKQTYVETVDNAYMKVVSGAFDYNSAINSAVQELAEKGITLKDKAGRNVQLEVAVRRNIMAGVQATANNINRDIEEELGCDGYEVTAHMGARPSHAEAQGKQYAINHRTKISRQYPLWKNVEDLWDEYNCRHTYFGIILGVSEPSYTDKELKEMKDATVKLNGKEVSYYEATQKQRQFENAIRKQKRAVESLEKAGQDATVQRSKLRQLQKEHTTFCNETGLQKDYSRIKVAKVSTIKEKDVKITIDNLCEKLNIDISKYNPEENNNITEQVSKILKMNELPAVVSDDKFKNIEGAEIVRYVKSNEDMTAEEVYKNTLYGDIRYSSKNNSQFGRGIYFGEKTIDEELLYTYGNGNGKAINAKISKEAKILKFNSKIDYIRDAGERVKKLPENLQKFYKNERSLLYMLDGYDGIKIDGKNYYCIYNRKVLIVKDE